MLDLVASGKLTYKMTKLLILMTDYKLPIKEGNIKLTPISLLSTTRIIHGAIYCQFY